MRETGLRVLGRAAWGTHLASFYETKEDLVEIVVPYLKAGVENNECCVWVVPAPLTEADAQEALRHRIDLRHHGHIEVALARHWYFTGGRLDVAKVSATWDARLRSALAKGYAGLRVAASVDWLGPHDWETFFGYEERLNGDIADKAMLVLCAYPLTQYRGAQRENDIRRSHPSVVEDSGEQTD